MIPLIDGDVVLCRAGFAVESRYYTVGIGGHLLASFQYKKEAQEFIKENELEEEADIELCREAESVENAKWIVYQILDNILDYRGNNEGYEIFLTGEDNFRKADYPDYKANRDPADKPIHEKALQDHLIQDWEADLVAGVEADDMMAIMQSNDTVICTIDKDLDMVPGLHYNFVTGEEYFIDVDTATQNFLAQLLSGDSTDNIHGIKGVGSKRAENYIQGWIMEGLSHDDILQEIYNMYLANNSEEEFFKNAELLWIWRQENDNWRNHFAGF